MQAPLLLVTRPEPQASEWVQQLQQRGCRAQALPLIRIEALPNLPVDPPKPNQSNHDWLAVLFVSPSAVTHCPSTWLNTWFSGKQPAPRAWTPGPGTAAALQQVAQTLRLPPFQLDAPDRQAQQFDSESLWLQVNTQIQPGDNVLILRGSDSPSDSDSNQEGSGREWLADQIRARQGQVHYQAVYQRQAPTQLPDWVQQEKPSDLVWLFSSSQAVQHLQRCSPHDHWQQGRALATHPRIAQAATQMGFANVQVIPPEPDAIAQALHARLSL
jgi:uroporphyrinogen-III synthase